MLACQCAHQFLTKQKQDCVSKLVFVSLMEGDFSQAFMFNACLFRKESTVRPSDVLLQNSVGAVKFLVNWKGSVK